MVMVVVFMMFVSPSCRSFPSVHAKHQRTLAARFAHLGADVKLLDAFANFLRLRPARHQAAAKMSSNALNKIAANSPSRQNPSEIETSIATASSLSIARISDGSSANIF
jgi:hypothetical protein